MNYSADMNRSIEYIEAHIGEELTTERIARENQEDFPQALRRTWTYIFREWVAESGYDYDERCHFRADTMMDIYVPIAAKS